MSSRVVIVTEDNRREYRDKGVEEVYIVSVILPNDYCTADQEIIGVCKTCDGAMGIANKEIEKRKIMYSRSRYADWYMQIEILPVLP